jgi:hypothetical protein
MEAELKALEAALGTPQRPVVAVVGGAKVSTKIELLANLVTKVDHLVIGGGMANTFLVAEGDRGRQVAGRARHGRNRAGNPASGAEGGLPDPPAGRCGGRARVQGGGRRQRCGVRNARRMR